MEFRKYVKVKITIATQSDGFGFLGILRIRVSCSDHLESSGQDPATQFFCPGEVYKAHWILASFWIENALFLKCDFRSSTLLVMKSHLVRTFFQNRSFLGINRHAMWRQIEYYLQTGLRTFPRLQAPNLHH